MMTNFKFCPVCGSPPQPSNTPTQMYGNPSSNPNPRNNPIPPNQNNYYNNNYYQNSNPMVGMKSESTTLILSIVLGLLGLSGIGHMYVGKVGKGVGILIGNILLWVIGFATMFFGVGFILLIVGLVLFIWQIIDSKKLCVYYNDHLRRTGSPPW